MSGEGQVGAKDPGCGGGAIRLKDGEIGITKGAKVLGESEEEAGEWASEVGEDDCR